MICAPCALVITSSVDMVLLGVGSTLQASQSPSSPSADLTRTSFLMLCDCRLPQVAGTEQGVTEPEATFSACFGGAFLMWHPMKVRAVLSRKPSTWPPRRSQLEPGFCSTAQ